MVDKFDVDIDDEDKCNIEGFLASRKIDMHSGFGPELDVVHHKSDDYFIDATLTVVDVFRLGLRALNTVGKYPSPISARQCFRCGSMYV